VLFEAFPVVFQTLQWDCPGGLTGGDVLKVEVYDHETVGKNRCVMFGKSVGVKGPKVEQ